MSYIFKTRLEILLNLYNFFIAKLHYLRRLKITQEESLIKILFLLNYGAVKNFNIA